MINVGIVGATGYTGAELIRLLVLHPEVNIQVITSRAEQGKQVSDIYPGLRGHLDLEFSSPDTEILYTCDVVFFATPNATAMHKVPGLLKKDIRVVDLSADFRIKDATVWSSWYGQEHSCPELLMQAVYGLPEIYRHEISNALLVANPGCYPTAVILGLLPILEAGIVDTKNIIVDAKSGVSGAGRKIRMSSQFCEVNESFKAYAASGHRHLPEINQILNFLAKDDVVLTFVPHLIPIIRGIHATIYVNLHETSHDLQDLYVSRYLDEVFVDVLPAGAHPDTYTVRGTNICRLALHQPQGGNILVVLSVIDNLIKGAAGQAVQNMNIMFGLDEKTGIVSVPLLG